MTVTTVTPASPIEIPPGTIMPWLGGRTGSAPAGWLTCDGGAVSRSTYGALFAAIGVSYGAGDGSLTFNLPGGDRFLVGAAAGTRTTSGTGNHSHAWTPAATASLSGATNHAHAVNNLATSAYDTSHSHIPNYRTSNDNSGTFQGWSGTANLLAAVHSHTFAGFSFNASEPNHAHNVNAASVAAQTSHTHSLGVGNSASVSGETAHLPPYVDVWHLIKI